MKKSITNFTDFETVIDTLTADAVDMKNYVIFNHTNAHGTDLTIWFLGGHLDKQTYVINISVGYADSDHLGTRITFYHDEESPIGLKFPWEIIQKL